MSIVSSQNSAQWQALPLPASNDHTALMGVPSGSKRLKFRHRLRHAVGTIREKVGTRHRLNDLPFHYPRSSNRSAA
jgi:hypothetical protein